MLFDGLGFGRRYWWVNIDDDRALLILIGRRLGVDGGEAGDTGAGK